MRRFVLVVCLTGCQAIAGIDDRVVAPIEDSAPVDASVDGAASGDDTLVAPETAATDTAEDTATDTAAVTDTHAADASDTSTSDSSDASAASPVVINEVRATDGDYVELFNTGTAAVDISGWGLTGTEDSGGFSIPIRFSAGESLAPGAHLLILAGMPEASGPQTSCGVAGPARCYHAPWGISQTRGETLRLLRGDDSLANEMTYPMNGHADGQSWGRVPDGTGAFAPNKPTPGAPNAAL